MTLPFTVVVPCFNDGETLPATLASLGSQQAHEVILVDDGSDDPNTLAVIEAASGRGITVIRQQNQGLSAARMTGVRASSTELVIPLDADDLAEPGAFHRLAQALTVNDEAAVAFSDYAFFGTVKGVSRCSWAWDRWLITYVNLMPGPGTMIRRDPLLRVGGWSLKRGYEDWDLWMSLIEAGYPAVYVPGISLHYRQRPNRMLSAAKTTHADLFGQARDRHHQLFSNRSANWRYSTAPTLVRWGIPALWAIPGLSEATKNRLSLILAQPRRNFSVRAQRIRAIVGGGRGPSTRHGG